MYKLYKRIKIKDKNTYGYIDAITSGGRLRIRTFDGYYEWVYEYQIEGASETITKHEENKLNDKEKEEKPKLDLRYLG